MNKKVRGGHRRKRLLSRALSLVLSAVMLVGGIGMSYTTPVYAETTVSASDVIVVDETVDTTVSQNDVAAESEETVENTVTDGEATVSEGDTTVSENDATVSEEDATVSEGDTTVPVEDTTVSEGDVTVSEGDATVSQGDAVLMSLKPLAASTFDGSATFDFGTDVTNANVFDSATGIGFSDVEYNTAATGWSGGVYYPRVASKNHEAGASYVTNGDGYLTIASKVWSETESSGQGTYVYENTSSFDMVLDSADYTVSVTLVNPTDTEYTAYLEAEDITKKSGIKVAAGAEVTESFTAILIDGTLNLKFLAASSATSMDAAATQNVYVSKVTVAAKAAKEPGIKPTIFIASDSTVQTYEDYNYPQTGWGQTLYQFFGELVEERECDECGYSQSQTYETENVIVQNRALGGRSSKSFIEEGKLDDLLEDVKPGDYVFVQWGHNDATAARPNRYVAPADFEKWIQYYVDGAIQRGATPVLVTPVARYSYTTNADGSFTFVGNFEKYGDVMREMAAEQELPLIDLTASSVALCNSFGIDGAKSLFLIMAPGEYENFPSGSNDSTHLQYYGAYKFSQCIAKDILANDILKDTLGTLVELVLPENVPGAVTNLKNGSVGSTSIAMKWDAATDAELYYIYRQVLAEGQTIDDVDFTNAEKYSASSITTYTDSNCESGLTYVYAVRAFNELGLGEISEKIEVTTKSAGWKFDINASADASLTEPGWTGVFNEMYDAERGWGWITYPGGGRDRGEQTDKETYSLMGRDFSLGEGEFALDLDNGDYEVTCYGGDLMTGSGSQKTAYTAEGKAIGTFSAREAIGSVTNTVRVMDGQLNINIVKVNPNIYFNGFTVTEVLKAPTGFSTSELTIDTTTGTASYLISFNPVEEAVSYNVYAKNSTDTVFSVVKSFTVAEYAADDLACRAMVGDAGEEYELYITCVTADGTESAPSNTVELALKEDGEPAAAPQNFVCTSPVEGDTELQKSISLQWDKVEGAFKYIIYRSTKLEDEKGYKGFEKIGESKTTTYTDTDDVATNINYYYKVAAMTKTGLGNFSEICKTPITGKMVAGARETYTDRALVAINLAGADGGETLVSATDSEGNEYTSGVYVSWRSFGADLDADNNVTTTFTVYKNGAVLASDLKVTNLIDPSGTASDTYKVVGSNDGAIGVSAKDTAVWANKYLELSLYCPEEATMPDGSTCTYEANDMSVGDLNGDGDLELIVKWYPSNAKDNSGYGYTGKTYLDGYNVDFATGKTSLMWRIDMGVNIRSGAHYTQFQVWDFDCDGKAEIAVKTADGTTTYKSTDGTLTGLEMTGFVGACSSDALPTNTISEQYDYRNTDGFILEGPEYFSIFNGEDGTKTAEEVEYLPGRGQVSAWGDGYGNRVDRFLSATAYLNGETPFAVFARGYYTRTCLTAYYLKSVEGNGEYDYVIDTYWEFDTNEAGTQYEAQGNHGLSVNDIDNDGKDEIIYGALVIDHNGRVKYSTGLGHGDAMHVSDWVSWNDGLEIMSVHEHDDADYHVEVRDAETGKILMGYYTGKDTGRGVAADIDPTAEGAEWWSIASPTYESNDEPAWDSTNGEVYSTWSTLEEIIKLADCTPASNASIFWDGDLLSEIQDHKFNNKDGAYDPIGVVITKWDYENEEQDNLLYSEEIWSTNGTKGNVGLMADILGDWREEIIARTSADRNVVRIYSTTIETDYVVPCLLENLAYREGVAWQNVGYNQPANLSFLLSEGLVTAELSEGAGTTANEAEILFTPANDGIVFGHDITAYKVYRAANGGEFEEIATIPVDELEEGENSGGDVNPEPDPEPEPDPDPVWLKFDFGAGTTQAGWTAVDASDAFSTEKGYGFTDVSTNSNKSYAGAITGDNADMYNDAVLAWTTAATGFDVVVPNGTYDVTYYIYNGSGHVYNLVTAEGVAYADVRRGATDKQATCQTVQVEVTDGVLNIVNTGSKTNYNGLYFTGIEIKDVTYDAWYEAWLEETKPMKYQFDFGAVATQEGWTAVDASDAFSTEKGYGFTDVSTNSNKSYAGAITGENANMYNDAVLAWTTAATGFDVVVPNGTYDVVYYIYNGSGHVYNLVTAEGVAYADVRRGATDKQATCQTVQVEVTDGVLNIVNTGSKTNYNGLYFTGIEIIPEGYDAAYAEWYKLYCEYYGIVPDIAPTWLKFDFGAGTTQEGWTAVDATEVFSTAKGYGFTDVSTNANKDYTGAITGDNADVYNDAVLAWTTAATGFDVVVPNGTYDVTYYIYNGSGHVYNLVTAEGVAYADVRRGATDKQATCQTVQVEVTDGVLNIVNTGSKTNYNGLYFTGIEIKDVTYDAWYEAWLEKTKPVKYQFDFGAVATQEGWTAVDAADAFSTEKGYGFTDVSTNANKDYTGAITGDNADVYNDAVLAWTTAATGFDVVVPNGAYDVTYYIYNGSGHVYNLVTAEGVAYADVRRGATDKQATCQTVQVEVTDGVLNIVNTGSKNNYNGLYFTGIEIIPVGYDEAYAEWYALYTAYYGDEAADGSGDTSSDATATASVQLLSLAAYDVTAVADSGIALAAADDNTDDSNASDADGGELVYSYIDTNLTGNTEYTYKIAAVVDDKASHMSRPLTIKTAVDIKEVPTIELDNLVEGTPLTDGKTVADLLPATIKVVDATGTTVDCDVTWDASEVDINKVGDYTVYASIKGQTEKYSATLTVEANAVKGVEKLDAVDLIINVAPSTVLPEKVKVEYTNTTSEEVAVTWDTTTLDNQTLGEYKVYGTLTGFDNKAEITVKVIPNYIVSVAAGYAEIDLNTKDAEVVLPETVVTTWGDGAVTNEAVTWKDVVIDTSVIGVNTFDGTVEGYTGEVKLYAEVSYPAVYRFDFGIDNSIVEDDDEWTVVTVNVKNGTKTMEELDIHYTAERGYGFATPDKVFDGRTELFTYAGDLAKGVYLPDKVFGDYAMPNDNFIVDVPNGKYVVELFGAVNNGKSTIISCKVEGNDFRLSTQSGTYGMGSVEVEVTDGQLDIDYTGQSMARTAAIIIREVEVYKVPDSGSDDSDDSDDTTTNDTPTNDTTQSTTTDTTTTGTTTDKATDTTTDNASGEVVKELKVDVTTDWNDVVDAVETLLAEADGGKAVLALKLGLYNVIEKEAVDAIKGKDVTIQMEQENGIIWEINGLDVESAQPVDLEVLLGSDEIPADAVTALAGDKECWGVSLTHNGEFGFTATMKVPFEAKNNGKFANLFYYNDKNEFEFMSSYEIADGYAEFLYTHASEYLIVISETAMTAASVVKPDTTVTKPEETPKQETTTEQSTQNQQTPAETVETPEESGSNLPMILIIIAVLVVGAAAIVAVVMRKKKEEE